MRSDTIVEDGERYAQPFWLVTLCVLSVIDLLLYATTLHPYGKAVTSGAVHTRHYVSTAMLLRVDRSAILKGGRGIKNEFITSVYTCLRQLYDFITQK